MVGEEGGAGRGGDNLVVHYGKRRGWNRLLGVKKVTREGKADKPDSRETPTEPRGNKKQVCVDRCVDR